MFRINNDNFKYISLINLDKVNPKYLIPLFLILSFKNKYNINFK